MVELRSPPDTTRPPRSRDGLLVALVIVQLVLLGVVVLVMLSSGRRGVGASGGDPELLREVSSELRAAGALEESARLLEEHLQGLPLDSEDRPAIAYSLGQTYLDAGLPERALRWFYEAESLDSPALRDEVKRKIVHSLERLGRVYAAQAAIDQRVQLDSSAAKSGDPVVATIGEREIRRSEVLRAADDAGLSQRGPASDEQLGGWLRQYVAEELLYNKATKLEYDRDPVVRRSAERLRRQLIVGKFVESEVLSGIDPQSDDVANFFEANRSRYAQEGEDVELADVQQRVLHDYVSSKAQTEYQQLIDSELRVSGAVLYPERLSAGSSAREGGS